MFCWGVTALQIPFSDELYFGEKKKKKSMNQDYCTHCLVFIKGFCPIH